MLGTNPKVMEPDAAPLESPLLDQLRHSPLNLAVAASAFQPMAAPGNLAVMPSWRREHNLQLALNGLLENIEKQGHLLLAKSHPLQHLTLPEIEKRANEISIFLESAKRSITQLADQAEKTQLAQAPSSALTQQLEYVKDVIWRELGRVRQETRDMLDASPDEGLPQFLKTCDQFLTAVSAKTHHFTVLAATSQLLEQLLFAARRFKPYSTEAEAAGQSR